MNRSLLVHACAGLLFPTLLAACASGPAAAPGSADPGAASPSSPSVLLAVESAPSSAAGECRMALVAVSGPGVPAHTVSFQVGVFQRDPEMQIGLIEGDQDIPPGTGDGAGGARMEVFSENLLVDCGTLRADFTVVSCTPGSCPVYRTDPALKVFPLQVVGGAR